MIKERVVCPFSMEEMAMVKALIKSRVLCN